MRRTFLVKNTYSACNTLYCLWEKKEQEPFEEFSMWKVLNALSTNRPEQIKRAITTAAATTIGYK